jgi:hypothetical protein
VLDASCTTGGFSRRAQLHEVRYLVLDVSILQEEENVEHIFASTRFVLRET